LSAKTGLLVLLSLFAKFQYYKKLCLVQLQNFILAIKTEFPTKYLNLPQKTVFGLCPKLKNFVVNSVFEKGTGREKEGSRNIQV